MATEAQRNACKRYYWRTKDKKKCYMVRLDKGADADVIAVLDSVPNKTKYIAKLVRRDADGGQD